MNYLKTKATQTNDWVTDRPLSTDVQHTKNILKINEHKTNGTWKTIPQTRSFHALLNKAVVHNLGARKPLWTTADSTVATQDQIPVPIFPSCITIFCHVLGKRVCMLSFQFLSWTL